MVLSFIISDLNCQILYSTIFDFKQNTLENANLQEIVRKVKSEFDFNFSVSPSSNSDDLVNNSLLDFETKGIINVKLGNSSKPVIYQSFCGCLYILICDFSDNRLLAYRTLSVMIHTLRDIVPKMMNFTSQFIVRADAVSMIVNAFIPSGHMLFLQDQAVQQIYKDLQKLLR